MLKDDAQLLISSIASVIVPWHKLLDTFREKARGGTPIGTTGRGIGPAYEDKVARRGIRMRDLLHPDRLAAKVKERLPWVLEELKLLADHAKEAAPVLDEAQLIAELLGFGEKLRVYVGDCSQFLSGQSGRGERILFEGAQGTLLDVDHGTYPYVTSSNCVAGNAAAGSGVGPGMLHYVLGITKAYCTRVGGGPFPTELDWEKPGTVGWHLSNVGAEKGVTTGRSRRCGWFDAALL